MSDQVIIYLIFAVFAGAAYFRPIRAAYKWIAAWVMLNSGSPLARTLAHRMGYTYNEHGWITKMASGERLDPARVAHYGAMADLKAMERQRQQEARRLRQ